MSSQSCFDNMFRYLYNAFNRWVARATQPTESVSAETQQQPTESVNAETQQQLELYARLNEKLDMAPMDHRLHNIGLTYEQKIRIFRALPLDHPHVQKTLEIFQWVIDENRLDDDGSIMTGSLADMMGLFDSDEEWRQNIALALSMGRHERLGAGSALQSLSADTLSLITSFC